MRKERGELAKKWSELHHNASGIFISQNNVACLWIIKTENYEIMKYIVESYL